MSRSISLIVSIFLLIGFEASYAQAPSNNDQGPQGSAMPSGMPGSMAGRQPEGWQVTGGVGFLISNDYRGADQARIIPLPYIDLRYDRFFFNPGQGLGVNVINWRDKEWSYQLTAALAPQFANRDAGDIPGVDPIDFGIESRITGTLGYKNFQAFATWREALFETGNNGTTFDFGLAYQNRLRDGTIFRVGPQARWISDNAAQAFYRVTPRESAASGLDVFRTRNGLEQVSLNGFILKPISERWAFTALLEAGYLLDRFAASPIVETRFQSTLITAVTYRF